MPLPGPRSPQASHSRALHSERACQAIDGLEDLLRRFPLTDPTDASLSELLPSIRSRFKVAAAALGLTGTYARTLQQLHAPSEGARPVGSAPVDF